MPNHTWTYKQFAILKKEYPTIEDPRALAKRLKKSYHAIKSKVGLLGLKRKKRSGSVWTSAMKKRLIKLYPNITNVEIAKIMGLQVNQIPSQAFKLGLHKSKEFMYLHSMRTAYRKGDVPVNKGKKMSRELYKKAAPTMFKKGHVSSNTLFNGAIRVRHHYCKKNYKYIRLAPMKWIPLQKFIWEKQHGPIPPGHCLWFMDQDPMNCVLSNLELITRGDNVKRNSGSLRLTDGYVAFVIVGKNRMHLYKDVLANKKLIEAKRQQIILKRQINGQKATMESAT